MTALVFHPTMNVAIIYIALNMPTGLFAFAQFACLIEPACLCFQFADPLPKVLMYCVIRGGVYESTLYIAFQVHLIS